MNKHIAMPGSIVKIWQGLLFSWLCTMSLGAHADAPETVVQNKLSAIHTLHAHFSQTVHAKRHLISTSSGVMVVARPNRFRWQTLRPMAQSVVADGKTVWIYDVELEQVTVSKQTRKLGVAGALFLSGDADAVKRDFKVTSRQLGTTVIFDLHAKSSKSSFDRVRLTFKKGILADIELDDQLGQHTAIHLSQVVINQPQPARLFHLHIPAGVDVVHQ